jgi:hypothetical protein
MKECTHGLDVTVKEQRGNKKDTLALDSSI